MTVWVVEACSWDGSVTWTIGVFSDYERAMRCAGRYRHRTVTECQLDPETMP